MVAVAVSALVLSYSAYLSLYLRACYLFYQTLLTAFTLGDGVSAAQLLSKLHRMGIIVKFNDLSHFFLLWNQLTETKAIQTHLKSSLCRILNLLPFGQRLFGS